MLISGTDPLNNLCRITNSFHPIETPFKVSATHLVLHWLYIIIVLFLSLIGDVVNDIIDNNDRQLIDRALEQTNTPDTKTCTNPRLNPTDHLQNFELHFLESVLPMP